VAKSKEEKMLDKVANNIIRTSSEEENKIVEPLKEKKISEEKEDREIFAHLVKKYENPIPPREGDIIKAKVVEISREGVLLDVGMKSEGFMPWGEYSSSSDKIPQSGESMNVYVMHKSETGRLFLSKKEADFRLDWAKFARAFEKGKPIQVKVTKVVKGGLLASVGCLNCFIPASHVSLKRNVDLNKYLGKTLEVRVIELDKKSKNIVASRKFLELEEKEKRKEKTLASLEEGKIVRGRVNSITKFGVFVDLGGIDGLIHPENLSWGWVKNPREVVNLNQEIEVKVLKLDRNKGKISLGLKQTRPDPWSLVKEKYQVGSMVSGKVTHLTNFGAFVEIEEGLEGLIHISDLSWDKRISHPKEVVYVGQTLEVKILDINAREKRMALGLKQIQPDPWQKLVEKYKVGDVVSGKVQEITNFGVFVNLAPGIDGLIHVSELDSEYVHHPEKIISVGEKIRAEIVEINSEKRRIRLSVKKLKEKEEKGKEKSAPVVSSDEDEEIVIGDFIKEEIRERLKQGFSR
jgi:small subunit ribosomal protein S1